MQKLFRLKVKNFVIQILLTPISAIINILVLSPILIWIGGDNIPLGNAIWMIFITVAAGFAANEFFIRLKGKETSEDIEVTYYGEDVDVKERFNTFYVTITPYVETVKEKRLTFWGLLARIFCFVALPLRLVALVMSYVALFFPRIFVTHKELNPNYGVGNRLLHTLFDFVILPANGERFGRISAKGIIWIFVYLLSWVISNFLSVWLISSVLAKVTYILTIVEFFVACFCILSSIILTLKYVMTISFHYSGKYAFICLLKILAFPAAMGILCVLFSLLPF